MAKSREQIVMDVLRRNSGEAGIDSPESLKPSSTLDGYKAGGVVAHAFKLTRFSLQEKMTVRQLVALVPPNNDRLEHLVHSRPLSFMATTQSYLAPAL
jgi:hypothetical protein